MPIDTARHGAHRRGDGDGDGEASERGQTSETSGETSGESDDERASEEAISRRVSRRVCVAPSQRRAREAARRDQVAQGGAPRGGRRTGGAPPPTGTRRSARRRRRRRARAGHLRAPQGRHGRASRTGRPAPPAPRARARGRPRRGPPGRGPAGDETRDENENETKTRTNARVWWRASSGWKARRRPRWRSSRGPVPRRPGLEWPGERSVTAERRGGGPLRFLVRGVRGAPAGRVHGGAGGDRVHRRGVAAVNVYSCSRTATPPGGDEQRRWASIERQLNRERRAVNGEDAVDERGRRAGRRGRGVRHGSERPNPRLAPPSGDGLPDSDFVDRWLGDSRRRAKKRDEDDARRAGFRRRRAGRIRRGIRRAPSTGRPHPTNFAVRARANCGAPAGGTRARTAPQRSARRRAERPARAAAACLAAEVPKKATFSRRQPPRTTRLCARVSAVTSARSSPPRRSRTSWTRSPRATGAGPPGPGATPVARRAPLLGVVRGVAACGGASTTRRLWAPPRAPSPGAAWRECWYGTPSAMTTTATRGTPSTWSPIAAIRRAAVGAVHVRAASWRPGAADCASRRPLNPPPATARGGGVDSRGGDADAIK